MSTKTKSQAMKYMDKIIGSPMTIGSELQAYRMAEDVNQEKLAKKLGISRVHLSQIERGKKFLSPERAAAFARKLGYSERVFLELCFQDQLNRANMRYKIKLEAA